MKQQQHSLDLLGRGYDAKSTDSPPDYLVCAHTELPLNRSGLISPYPRLRRILLALLALAAFSYYVWKWYLQPQWSDEREYVEGFRTAPEDFLDIEKHVKFHGTRLLDLDPELLPGGVADPEGNRRLIFVGDIHGCSRELQKLLKKLDFDPLTDHLVAVGDVISKGPDSAGVLDLLIRNNASSVRGNHEDRVLALAPSILDSAPYTADGSSKTFSKDSDLLRQLSPEHLKYLYDMPLILRVPPLPLARKVSAKTSSPLGEEILVVHAGLVPAVSLKKQSPYFVMNMRAIHTKTHRPFVEAESKKAKTKAWHEIWCWYNERLFKHKSLKDFHIMDNAPVQSTASWSLPAALGYLDNILSRSKHNYPRPQVVIYGHRSKEGLQLERWTKGLDTGCVNGGKLTAFVLTADGEHDIVQVKCEDYNS